MNIFHTFLTKYFVIVSLVKNLAWSIQNCLENDFTGKQQNVKNWTNTLRTQSACFCCRRRWWRFVLLHFETHVKKKTTNLSIHNRVSVRIFRRRWHETFKKRYHSDKNLEQVLLVRAWVLHCIISINRLSQLGTKNSMFLDVQCENCPPYNQELLDSRHKYFRYIVIALTAIGVLIDILAVKWRSLAHCFIYLE